LALFVGRDWTFRSLFSMALVRTAVCSSVLEAAWICLLDFVQDVAELPNSAFTAREELPYLARALLDGEGVEADA